MRFCCYLQTGLLGASWPKELLDSDFGQEVRNTDGLTLFRGLRVRCGVHVGYPFCFESYEENLKETNYCGPDLDFAVFLTLAGQLGQILVSSRVHGEISKHLKTIGSPYVIDLGEQVTKSKFTIPSKRLTFFFTKKTYALVLFAS